MSNPYASPQTPLNPEGRSPLWYQVFMALGVVYTIMFWIAVGHFAWDLCHGKLSLEFLYASVLAAVCCCGLAIFAHRELRE